MRDIWLIAKREYLEQVRGKAFKVTTVLIPLVFIGIFALIAIAGKNSGEKTAAERVSSAGRVDYLHLVPGNPHPVVGCCEVGARFAHL